MKCYVSPNLIKRVFVSLLPLLLLNCEIFAQATDPVYLKVPSSNAISLGSYTECPVSLFTGMPQINIPLYELKGNIIDLQISLSYYASGIRPEVHPGWVGNGWTLNAGGAITRVINGINDDQNNTLRKGFMFSDRSNFLSSTWSSDAIMSEPLSYEGNTDWIADEFYFNFMGIQGKFFLDYNGTWRVQSDEPLTVIFDKSSSNFITPFAISVDGDYAQSAYYTKAFCKFIIIDSKGTKYTFGGADAIEYTDLMFPEYQYRGADHYATSWFLTKIESANGEEVVNLTYERGPFTSQLHRTIFSEYISGANGGFLAPGCELYSARNSVNGQVVSPVYLKSIEFPSINQLINFETSESKDLKYKLADYHLLYEYSNVEDFDVNNYGIASNIPFFGFVNITNYPTKEERFIWLKLDKINIVNAETEVLSKRIELNYLEETSKRLELSSVNFYDDAAAFVNNFEFLYNATSLPDYLESITDHWGFNNNIDFPSSLFIPNIYNYRLPSSSLVQAGILTSIKYPTGGTVTFEYEPNKYHYYVSPETSQLTEEDGVAGGVRIKKITSDDGGGNQLIKNYYYVENFSPAVNVSTLTSSGILEVKPKYAYTASGKDNEGISFTYNFISSNPVIPLSSTSSGRYIGYSEVVELLSDGGYSIYKFSSQKDGYFDLLPVNAHNPTFSFVNYYTTKENERGRLLSKIDYTSAGKKAHGEVFNYAPLGSTITQRAKTISQSDFQVCNASAGRFCFSRTAYYRNYYKFLLNQKETAEYNTNDESILTKTTENLVYNDYGLVSEATNKLSNGEISVTKIKYPVDYYFDPLTENCIRSFLACISGCDKLDVTCLDQCDLDYTDCTTNMPVGSSETSAILKMQSKHMSGQVVEKQLFRRVGNTDFLLKGSLFKFQSINEAVLPKEVLELNTQSPLLNIGFSFINQIDGSLSYNSMYKTADVYDFFDSKFNVLQYHRTDNYFTSFLWGYNRHLPIARVDNAEVDDVGYESFEVESEQMDSWMYMAGSRSDDYSKTGKYSYFDAQLIITPEKQSVVSLWAKGGTTSPSIEGYTPFFTYTDSNGWTYYEWHIESEAVVLSSFSTYIDDVRLYPIGALMTTYTYDPLVGMTSQTDPNGMTTYYEYDTYGRLEFMRDDEHNIIKHIKYNYAQ